MSESVAFRYYGTYCILQLCSTVHDRIRRYVLYPILLCSYISDFPTSASTPLFSQSPVFRDNVSSLSAWTLTTNSFYVYFILKNNRSKAHRYRLNEFSANKRLPTTQISNFGQRVDSTRMSITEYKSTLEVWLKSMFPKKGRAFRRHMLVYWTLSTTLCLQIIHE